MSSSVHQAGLTPRTSYFVRDGLLVVKAAGAGGLAVSGQRTSALFVVGKDT